ncbi:MAG: hypothetical protein ACREOO_27820 [bacterium]
MVKLQLRLPESVHGKVRKIAKRENLSMNQLLVDSISKEIIRYETVHFFARRADDSKEEEFLAALQEIPKIKPQKGDRLK